MITVLLVDDSSAILDLLSLLLRGKEYEVTTAASGAEAAESLHSSPPDLIITDIDMPGDVDGFELVRTVRKDLGEDIAIIMMSGKPEHKDEVMACGANVFVAKPFELDSFLETIERVMAERT